MAVSGTISDATLESEAREEPTCHKGELPYVFGAPVVPAKGQCGLQCIQSMVHFLGGWTRPYAVLQELLICH